MRSFKRHSSWQNLHKIIKGASPACWLLRSAFCLYDFLISRRKSIIIARFVPPPLMERRTLAHCFFFFFPCAWDFGFSLGGSGSCLRAKRCGTGSPASAGIACASISALFAQIGPTISYRIPDERMMVESSAPVCGGSSRCPSAASPIDTPACGTSARPR